MKRALALMTLVAFACMWAAPAQAASPTSGTITASKRLLKWSGAMDESFPFPDPVLGEDLSCFSGEFRDRCDHFMLKVNLRDGAKVEVKINGARPCSADCLAAPVDGDDYDVFVYDHRGSVVVRGGTPAGVERVVFRHAARFKTYDVAVRPWAVLPGSTYKGTIKALTLR